MAEVGQLEWLTEVKNVAESKREAEQLGENFEGVASQANDADDAMDRLGGTSGDVNRNWGKLGRQGASLSGTLGMLTSGAILLLSKLGKLGGVSLGGLAGGGGGGGLLGGILGGLTASKLASKLPSIGLGSLFSGLTIRGLLRLLPIIGIGAILGGLVGGELGKLLGHENIGKLLGALAGGALALKLGTIGIGAILGKLGLGGLAAKLGSISIGAILAKLSAAGTSLATLLGSVGLGTIVAGVGSIAALIYGLISLGDLVDGDISSWNLPGKFGHALGQGFQSAWPDMADKIHGAFMNNPIADAGRSTGSMVSGNWEFTGFQSGGMVEETGPALLHENEAVLPSKLVDAIMRGSGGGDGGSGAVIQNQTIEIGDQQLDLSQLSRADIEDLADRIAEKQGGNLSTM